MIQQARAQRTRDAIIAGAAAVFDRQGYSTASIAEIASAAGVTKGALYFHFQSKDEIARAVMRQQHELSSSAAAAIIDEGRPALETMIRLCAGLVDQLVSDPVVKAGIRLTTDVSTFERPMVDPYEDWLNTVEGLIRRAHDEGDIVPTVDPGMLARFLIPALTGVQLVSDALSARKDLHERAREMWTIMIPGLVPADRAEDLGRLLELIAAPG